MSRKEYRQTPEYKALARSWNERNKERINQKRRERYAADPEYRSKVRARQKVPKTIEQAAERHTYQQKYYQTNKEEISRKTREYQKKHREHLSVCARRAKLKREFGITPEQYDQMLSAQNGVCAICERACPTGKNLAVDHCHETGKVRGLLCTKCNVSLGGFEDSLLLLEGAKSYLRKHQV